MCRLILLCYFVFHYQLLNFHYLYVSCINEKMQMVHTLQMILDSPDVFVLLSEAESRGVKRKQPDDDDDNAD